MSIHQEVLFSASAAHEFKTLTDSASFEKMSGGRKADVANTAGGVSFMFGGDIMAVNVEIVPDMRLVQAWRSQNWPQGVYSIVSFALEPSAKGTKLTFDQSGYPAGAHELLSGGWHKMYWEPMQKLLAG